MTFSLPPLPFKESALEPHMSKKTIEYHYGKHHKSYVDKLNKAIAHTRMQDDDLDEIIQRYHLSSDHTNLFNNAAQVWNHTFFWHSLSPDGGGDPEGQLKDQIEKDFGDLESFKSKFKQAGIDEFGSGWVWLTHTGSKLLLRSTTDAVTPVPFDEQPLLCCDVWEHAYYIDHFNERAAYLNTFLDKLVNWDFAAKNFDRGNSVTFELLAA